MTAGGGRRPVVVAVGAGAPDSDALAWGAAEAAARGAPLHLTHVLPSRLAIDPYGVLPAVEDPGTAAEVATSLVEAALDRARSVAPDVPLTGSVVPGTPARVLVQQSREAGLLVLGGRPAGSAGGWPAGGLGPRVAARASCPVVVVRARPRVRTPPSRPRVVVGVDATRSCAAALDLAFRAAAQRGLPVAAVHAWGPDAPADLEGASGSPAAIEAEAREVLDRVLDRCCSRFPEVPVERLVRCGLPAAVLVAESLGAALVVVGCRGRGPLRSALLGSTSRTVARRAAGPVAVVGAGCTAGRTTVPEDTGRRRSREASPRGGPPGDRGSRSD
ncbi:universal stress protein [Geodermatophilus sp. SYSU D00079]